MSVITPAPLVGAKPARKLCFDFRQDDYWIAPGCVCSQPAHRIQSPSERLGHLTGALIIVALIPLALRGVKYRAMNAEALLRRNLFIYGVGGLIAPFVGIKLIDMLITVAGLA